MYNYLHKLSELSEKGIKGVAYKQSHITQQATLSRFVKYDITVVYASGLMNDAVRKKLKEAELRYEENKIPISVLIMECPRLTKYEITEPSG
jgi:hypothetical protein